MFTASFRALNLEMVIFFGLEVVLGLQPWARRGLTPSVKEKESSKIVFCKLKKYIFMCMGVTWAFISGLYVCVWCSRSQKRALDLPGAGVTDGFEPACEHWEGNLDPLREQWHS